MPEAVERLPLADEHRGGYKRELYKHWNKGLNPTDGCNTRAEVILSEAVIAPTVEPGCKLTGGEWYSYYDGVIVTSATGLDVDHIVPLAEVHDSGGYDWPPQRPDPCGSQRRVAAGAGFRLRTTVRGLYGVHISMTMRQVCGVGVVDIPLVDAVAAVRDELLEAAARAGTDPQVVFAVGPVEMEFEVELRADAKAKAGFKLWAIGAETEAGLSRARSHRVSVTLTPKRPDGGDLLVSSAQERPSGPGDTTGRIDG
ncbi:trypco2 family protein [Kitasatospora sp. NPDC050467]|uniref:trypco2 family protein n=1 Tax=unclassified Kitasatospora TaxID=2633591 RepID=UPI0037ACBC59